MKINFFRLATLFALAQPIYGCLLHDHENAPREVSPNPDLLVRRLEPAGPPGKTAITNVRVFNGEHISLPTTVFIDGAHISTPFSPCTLFNTIDAGGRVLIPGLIDAHVHIPDVAGLEVITSYGVTTGLNMACRNYTECNALREFPKSPEGAGLAELFSAGIGATGPGSRHALIFNLPPDELIHEFDDPAAVIGSAFGNGSDYYKLCAEPNGPSQEMQNALVSEAHKLGKQTMTHAADTVAFLEAVESQTDGLQHIPADFVLSPDTVAKTKKNVQFVTPTMNIFKMAFENPLIVQILRGNVSTNETYSNVQKNVALLHEAGIPLLAGTDAVGLFVTPIANISIPFGLTLHWELEHLVEAGLSAAEALRAATSLVADMHGLRDRGRIEPGKRADLVLLDGNPLVNISNTQKISRVWAGGVELAR